MYLLDSLFLAVALAMDAFAISIVLAYNLKYIKLLQYAAIASSFAIFQCIMPISGYFLTAIIENSFNIANVQEYGAWLAFALLFIIGAKMIKESFAAKEEMQDNSLSFILLLSLAISTSLDAFSVGISFYLIQYPLFIPSIIIGVICFLISSIGLYIGSKLAMNNALGKRAELLGGIILICIGIRILAQSL